MESKPQPQPPSPTLLRRLINLDSAISLHLYTLFNPIFPFSVLKFLEFSGDGRLFFPIILSLLYTTTSLSTLTTTATLTVTSLLLLNLLLGSLLDLLLIGLLKHLIQRPRPVYNKNMFLSFAVDHWSFPSGHSSRVSFIATLISIYSASVEQILVTRLKFDADSMLVEYFVVIVGVWAAITSASRVLLGRHFVLDVVAGACLGVLEGIFVIRVFNYETLKSFLL
ncbi:probable lipid phosphate phosphatase beta [Olea europaea subsp. europaea]|uniref:Probable lipid phosphate phosphatase beta n=1 Tax=Olea europaea subsp. europaea TaxID=158383 RepID=A0A8S0QL77_OLEEU|nr:probable lipid phosphate phosphatase beta [Olea europaea subsp. europaea]